MRWSFVALIFASTFWNAVAQASQAEFFQTFASPRVEILSKDSPFRQRTPGRYPQWIEWLLTDVLAKDPDARPRPFIGKCRPDSLEQNLRAEKSVPRQAALIRKHFGECRQEVETGANSRWWNSFEALRYRLDIDAHPFLQKVMLNLPGGMKAKGILALKGDLKKRPFVVIRLGIFSSVEEFLPERFLLMQLFDQGPFNALVIENATSSDFVANNPGFSVGGTMEGAQNLQVAKMLRDPQEPLSKLVSSVHFAGISLGGHGLFFAAGLDSMQGAKPLVNSFVSLCPVVNLKETMHHSLVFGLRGSAVDYWTSVRLNGLKDRVSDLKSVGLSDWWKLQPFFLERSLKFAADTYPSLPGVNEGLKIPDSLKADFWTASDPWPWFKTEVPFLVLSTKEDDLVPYAMNSGSLEEKLKGRGANLDTVLFDRGFHCTLPVAYDWNAIAAILNGSLLSNAPGAASEKWETIDMDLGDVVDAKAYKQPATVSFDVAWPDGRNFVTLKIHAVTGDRAVDFSMDLPLSTFDFEFHNEVRTDSERRMLERWLFRRLRLDLVPKNKRTAMRVSWPAWN